MKVLTLTFSGTGNTLIAMNRVENALYKTGEIEISHFDATLLTKIIAFNRHPELPVPAQHKTYVESFKTELQHADVIGIGSFAYDLLPPSGAYELFNSEELPAALFSNLKYYFHVETCGGLLTPAPEMFYSFLLQKNAAVKSLGKVGAHTPDCAYMYLPEKGHPDGWLPAELAKLDAWGEELARNLVSETIKVVDMTPRAIPPFEVFKQTYAMMKSTDNSVAINSDTCIGCGTCERMCPYSVIELKPRQAGDAPSERGKRQSPKVAAVVYPDDCRLCARCVNYCPTRAIIVPHFESHRREQYKGVTIGVISKPPFTPGVPVDPQKTLLSPPSFGTLPSTPEMMLRSKNILNVSGSFTPYVTLSNGIKMPQFGLGVFKIPPAQTYDIVSKVLKQECKMIDTAHAYSNEREVGQAVKNSERERDDVWITSKLHPAEYGEGKTIKAIDRMLKRLQVDYLDLILLHMPIGDYYGAWKDLEAAYEAKKVRSIGISNFDIDESLMLSFLKTVRIKPHVMQIECHPYAQRKSIREICARENIMVQSRYPFAGCERVQALFTEPIIVNIAKAKDLLPAQVVIAWHIQSGLCPLPGTVNEAHFAFNMLGCYFRLSEEEMGQIETLDRNERAPEHVSMEALEKAIAAYPVSEE